MLPAYGGVTGWARAALAWAPHWMTGWRADGQTPLPVVLVTAGDDIRPQPGIQVSAERLDPERAHRPRRAARDDRRSGRCASRCGTPGRSARRSWRPTWRCRPTSSRSTSCGRSSRPVRLDGHPDGAARRCRSRTRTAGRPGDEPPAAGLGARRRLPAAAVQRAGLRPAAAAHRHARPPRRGGRRRRRVRRVAPPRTGRSGLATYAARRRSGSVGLEYFTVVAADAADRRGRRTPDASTRGRAGFAAPATRAWTVARPPWWIPTETVEQRRALTATSATAVPPPRRLSVVVGVVRDGSVVHAAGTTETSRTTRTRRTAAAGQPSRGSRTAKQRAAARPAAGKVRTQAVDDRAGHAPADGGEALGGAGRP